MIFFVLPEHLHIRMFHNSSGKVTESCEIAWAVISLGLHKGARRVKQYKGNTIMQWINLY